MSWFAACHNIEIYFFSLVFVCKNYPYLKKADFNTWEVLIDKLGSDVQLCCNNTTMSAYYIPHVRNYDIDGDTTIFALHFILKCSYKVYLYFEELRLKECKKLVWDHRGKVVEPSPSKPRNVDYF